MENGILDEKDIATTSKISKETIDVIRRLSEEFPEGLFFHKRDQNDIIQLQDSVEKEKLTKREDSANKITVLSELYKEDFPVLQKNFEEWELAREHLINLLRRTSDKLQRNSYIVSGFRIFTSAADIIGTLVRIGLNQNSIWADFAMKHASIFGLVSILLEMTISHVKHMSVKKEITREQERFKKVTDWIVLEQDPCFIACLNSKLSEEIQKKLNDPSTVKPGLYFDACNSIVPMVSMPLVLKFALSSMTIVTAGSKIWYQDKTEESVALNELSDKTAKELEKIRIVVEKLRPSDQKSKLDPKMQRNPKDSR